MMISTYIVDDEAHAVALLRGYVDRTPGMLLAGSSTSPLAALEEINSGSCPQLILMDVDMPELSGLELARLVGNRARIVFTTSYREFGPEAFDLSATDYLLKPFSYERFLKCVQKIRGLPAAGVDVKEPLSFFVKSGTKGTLLRIVADEISYIEAADNYIHIFLDRHRVSVCMGIAELLEKLPGGQFLRVHRSYVINRERIRALELGRVILEDGASIPLGRAYKTAFLNRFRDEVLLAKRDR